VASRAFGVRARTATENHSRPLDRLGLDQEKRRPNVALDQRQGPSVPHTPMYGCVGSASQPSVGVAGILHRVCCSFYMHSHPPAVRHGKQWWRTNAGLGESAGVSRRGGADPAQRPHRRDM